MTACAAEERALAIKLLQFGEVGPLVLDDFRPNLLANYLYDLAIVFHAFYEACPVLKAETADSRATRLVLCDVTARVLASRFDSSRNRMPRKNVGLPRRESERSKISRHLLQL